MRIESNVSVPKEVVAAVQKIKDGIDELGTYNERNQGKTWGANIIQKINPMQVVDVEPGDGNNDVVPSTR